MEPTGLSSQEITSCGEVFQKQGIHQRSKLFPLPFNLNITVLNVILDETGVGSHSAGSAMKKK